MSAKAALAFVARRGPMARGKWEMTMSLELGWMSPSQAKQYVQACLEAGLLVPDGDGLVLGFDAKEIEIPRGLRPSLADLSDLRPVEPTAPAPAPPAQPAANDFLAIVDEVAKRTGASRDEVLARVAAHQDRLGGLLDAQTAARWLRVLAG